MTEDIPVAVCLTHLRFVPDRRRCRPSADGPREGCVFSGDPEDIRMVSQYQYQEALRWQEEEPGRVIILDLPGDDR